MIPCLCAQASASAICAPQRSTCSRGKGKRSVLQTIDERLAFDELHDQEPALPLAPHVEQRADAGVVQRRDGARLALETGAGFLILRKTRGEDPDGHLPPEARVASPLHLPHAASADGREDLIGNDACAGCQGHGQTLYCSEDRSARGVCRPRADRGWPWRSCPRRHAGASRRCPHRGRAHPGSVPTEGRHPAAPHPGGRPERDRDVRQVREGPRSGLLQ